MKPVDRLFQKLLKTAARAPREPAGPPPFGLEAAVIAQLCNTGPEDEFARLVPLFRYAMVFGLVMVLLSGAWNYFEGQSSSGATALASFAMTQNATMNRKLKITLYLAAIFLTGVVTGMFISKLIVQHMMPSREKMVDHWCDDLRSKLDLTPEQLQKVRPIVEKNMTEFKEDLCRQMVANLGSCNAQIAAELTPAQKVKLDQLQKEQEGFIRNKFGGETTASSKSP